MKIVDSLGQVIGNGDILWYPKFASRHKQFNICIVDDENFYDDNIKKKRVIIANKHNALIATYMSAFHRSVKINPSMLDHQNKWHNAILSYTLHTSKANRY